jgi:hypothetical protein
MLVFRFQRDQQNKPGETISMQNDHDHIAQSDSPTVPDNLPADPVAESTLEDLEDLEDSDAKYDNLKTIWSSPRKTIRRIIRSNPTLYVNRLTFLAGIVLTLDRAAVKNAGDHMPFVVVLLLVCITGPLGGLINLKIGSYLIHFTGKWIGGTGSREKTETAIAWGQVPLVFALPIWLLQMLLLGSEIFKQEVTKLESSPIIAIAYLGTITARFILSVLAIVLLSNTIAEIQEYRSAWRGLGNIILAGGIILLPIIALTLIL